MFKFYNLPDIDTVEKIIGNSPTIKFSSAFDLNDPFELKFNLKVDPNSEKEKIEFFNNFPEKTLADFSEWQNQVTDQFLWYTEQEQRNGIAQTITLSCFTENNQNNLMWSHYTNNHQGICVEYSEELFKYFKSLDNYLVSNQVIYSNEPPTVENFESIESKAKKMLFNKQSEWKYEKEHRVILQSKKRTEYIPIDNKFIKAVYIGSKCDSKISEKIIQICNSHGIVKYHGITFGNTYKVQFEKHLEGTIFMKTFWQ